MKALFPDADREARVHSILSHMTREIQNYLWIKTFTSALTAGLSYAVLASIGVDFAGFWVVIIFLLNFIPTIGSLLGILFPRCWRSSSSTPSSPSSSSRRASP